jgi:mRNA interferase MazF
VVARGEVWWGEAPDEKGRPFLVVSRDAATRVMARVLVAPVTTRVRGVPSELYLGDDEGLPVASAASFDNIRPVPKSLLVRRLGALGTARRHELCAVAAATFDC